MLKYLKLACKEGFRILFTSSWLNRFIKHKDKYPIEERYQKVSSFINGFCQREKCLFIINGEENLLDENVLFVSNHQSNMDPLTLLSILKSPISFLSKQEVLKFPYVNKMLQAIDGVFMDRKDFRQELKCLKKVGEMLLEGKQSVVIFPEGTRSRDVFHPVNEFKPGAFKPAFYAKKAVIPIAMYGGFRVLDSKLEMKKYPIQISFLKPIKYDEFKDLTTIELSKKVEKEIEKEVNKLRDQDNLLAKQYCKRNYKGQLDISGL